MTDWYRTGSLQEVGNTAHRFPGRPVPVKSTRPLFGKISINTMREGNTLNLNITVQSQIVNLFLKCLFSFTDITEP